MRKNIKIKYQNKIIKKLSKKKKYENLAKTRAALNTIFPVPIKLIYTKYDHS